MKARRFFTVLCICCSLFMLVGCGVKETASTLLQTDDFRSFKWGDPGYLVRKEETAQIIYEGDERLMYWDKYYGYDSNITYCFNENELNNGYVSIQSDEDKNVTFKKIENELTKEYGEPYDKTKNSMKFNYKDDSVIYLSKDGLQVAVLYSMN